MSIGRPTTVLFPQTIENLKKLTGESLNKALTQYLELATKYANSTGDKQKKYQTEMSSNQYTSLRDIVESCTTALRQELGTLYDATQKQMKTEALNRLLKAKPNPTAEEIIAVDAKQKPVTSDDIMNPLMSGLEQTFNNAAISPTHRKKFFDAIDLLSQIQETLHQTKSPIEQSVEKPLLASLSVFNQALFTIKNEISANEAQHSNTSASSSSSSASSSATKSSPSPAQTSIDNNHVAQIAQEVQRMAFWYPFEGGARSKHLSDVQNLVNDVTTITQRSTLNSDDWTLYYFPSEAERDIALVANKIKGQAVVICSEPKLNASFFLHGTPTLSPITDLVGLPSAIYELSASASGEVAKKTKIGTMKYRSFESEIKSILDWVSEHKGAISDEEKLLSIMKRLQADWGLGAAAHVKSYDKSNSQVSAEMVTVINTETKKHSFLRAIAEILKDATTICHQCKIQDKDDKRLWGGNLFSVFSAVKPRHQVPELMQKDFASLILDPNHDGIKKLYASFSAEPLARQLFDVSTQLKKLSQTNTMTPEEAVTSIAKEIFRIDEQAKLEKQKTFGRHAYFKNDAMLTGVHQLRIALEQTLSAPQPVATAQKALR